MIRGRVGVYIRCHAQLLRPGALKRQDRQRSHLCDETLLPFTSGDFVGVRAVEGSLEDVTAVYKRSIFVQKYATSTQWGATPRQRTNKGVYMSEFVYAYGTLRPGLNHHVVLAKGELYDLGWFPGIKLGGNNDVVCERIEVQDLGHVDNYEGYFESDPDQSLYIRRPFLDGWIYEFNRDINPIKRIMSGDWLDYRQEKRGQNGGRF